MYNRGPSPRCGWKRPLHRAARRWSWHCGQTAAKACRTTDTTKNPVRSGGQRCLPVHSSPGGRGHHSSPSVRGRSSSGPQSAPWQRCRGWSWAQRHGRAGCRSQCGIRCPLHREIPHAAAVFRSGGRTAPACAAPAVHPGAVRPDRRGPPWGTRYPAADTPFRRSLPCAFPSRCGADNLAPASGSPGCGR